MRNVIAKILKFLWHWKIDWIKKQKKRIDFGVVRHLFSLPIYIHV